MAHEAAYDALMTGFVFAQLMAEGFCRPMAGGGLAAGGVADGGEAVVIEKENQLYLMRSLFSLNLHGQDRLMEGGTLLHLSGFDKRLKTVDLIALFAEGGDVRSDQSADERNNKRRAPQIRWIDDTSCIACLLPTPSTGLGSWGLRFRVWEGFGLRNSGFRVSGFGFRVWTCIDTCLNPEP